MVLNYQKIQKILKQIRAEVGMVFQQFNLFPHLSILDNCTLAPIWVKKMPKKQAEDISFKTTRKSSNRLIKHINFLVNYLVVNNKDVQLQEPCAWNLK